VPVISWGEEVKLLCDEVVESVKAAHASEAFQATLKAEMGRYIARSVANQFLWGRISGMTRSRCLALLPAAAKFLGWSGQLSINKRLRNLQSARNFPL
jgi:hypothetical protein